MKKNNYIFPLIVVFTLILGITLMLYPWFASWYSEQTRAEIHTHYQEQVASADTSVIEQIRKAAQEYNECLFSGQIDPMEPEGNGYYEQLDPMGTGVMGYINIDKINVSLPIYHGTDDKTLARGAGHMPQTSLPIGGINTHSVITAHNGMASSPMFTDLELLRPGDTFQVKVLGEILTYEIKTAEDIQQVLPTMIDGIKIRREEDLCSLITCIPFGVNSHRLVITGHRIPTPTEPEATGAASPTEFVDDEPVSVWETQYVISLTIGLVIAGSAIILAAALQLLRKKGGKYEAKKPYK